MRWIYLVLVLMILVTLLPFFWPLGAGLIADLAGCEISPAHEDPCMIFGADWSGALRFGLVSPWLGIYTLPVTAGLLLLLVLFAVVHLAFRLFRKD